MGDYVDIGLVHTWHETRGSGEPLVLLHGGLDTNAAWTAQLEVLAEHFRVLAPERRGHGHTPDVEGPISYRLMADDTAAFIDAVVGGPVHLVGWRDGAILGLVLAIWHPDLTRVPIRGSRHRRTPSTTLARPQRCSRPRTYAA